MSPGIPGRIPLFPLPDAVLFPQMPLPLHVFEPRYRRLVADVLGGQQTIGMTLLRPGWESDYEGRPPIYPVGCAGVIEQCEPLPDGRFTLVLRGASRFRVLEEHAGHDYRVASVEPLSDEPGEPGELEAARQRLLGTLSDVSDGRGLIVLQTEISHEAFVNALSQSLPLLPVERQSLLDCSTIPDRYARLIEILEFRNLEASRGGGGLAH